MPVAQPGVEAHFVKTGALAGQLPRTQTSQNSFLEISGIACDAFAYAVPMDLGGWSIVTLLGMGERLTACTRTLQ